MSLLVWLPLNGNLENQGLSNVTVTNNGATVDNSGKIGKCYKFDGSSNYLTIPATLSSLNKEFSICAWMKFNSTSGTYTLYTSRTAVGEGIAIFRLSGNNIRFDDGGLQTVFSNYNCTTEWTHICVTRDTTSKKLYVNGELKQSTTSVGQMTNLYNGTCSIGASTASGKSAANFLNGNMNDFRIYDHCLSAKEVKDLAKGLVLHYRLAGPGQENLFKNTSPVETKSNNEWIQLGNDTTAIFDTNGLITYTLSFDAKSEIAGSFDLYSTSGSNPKYTWPHKNINLTTNWQHFSYSFIPVLSNPSGTWSRASIYGTYSTGKIPSIKNVKLERGNVQTPWCPNSADLLYSTLGYNNNIEYDCSGYRRNGTKSGTLIWNIDSPRYTTSYSTEGGTAYLTSPNIFTSSINNFTLSIWGKTSNQGGRMIFSSGPATSNPALYHGGNLAWCIGDGDNNYFENNGVAIQAADYKDGKWHHYVVTGDGTENKLYIDGQYTGKSHIYHPLGYTYTIGKWIGDTSHNWNGLMSDFRIYVTTLSAEDIAELYHSAVIVDNTRKSYAYEYFEAQ